MKIRNIVVAMILFMTSTVTMAQTIRKQVVEGGGTGLYKAEVVSDTTCPGFTIYRPQNLKAAVATEGRLPVILYANGACANNNLEIRYFLNEVVSHGYFAIAIGPYDEDDFIEHWRRVMTYMHPKNKRVILANGEEVLPLTAEEIKANEDNMKKMMEEAKKKGEKFTVPQPPKREITNSKLLLEALDWITMQNSDPNSEYYQCLDLDKVAAMGQSCGGNQVLSVASDPRIKTCVILNSGIGDKDFQGTTKETLKQLHQPMLYLIGGDEDVAYENAAKDYARINNVPVTIINSPNDGHEGTYYEKHGGVYSVVVEKWLDWQLKGQRQNENFFRYGQMGDEFRGWTSYAKNFGQQPITMKIGNVDDKGREQEKRDIYGNVLSYEKVTSPSMKVCLPDSDKATGTAVIIQPGGALVSLAWESEFMKTARWLNAKGIAAIGVKYRLRDEMPKPPVGSKPLRLSITEFDQIKNGNINPSLEPSKVDKPDPEFDTAVDDVVNAVKLVRSNAGKWNIDPNKIGLMGFSAGGCVSLGAIIRHNKEIDPAFMCSVYGPSMIDVKVPENAPKLFIAVHGDHPNVAAGCLSLYMEWRKAGVDAEMHIYGKHTGGLFGGGPEGSDCNTSNGSWLESFYSWLKANSLVQ